MVEAVGAKPTLSVTLVPAASVYGIAREDAEKAPPAIPIWLMTASAFPLLATVKVCVAVEPVFTFPKFRFEGLTLITACGAFVAVPLKLTFKGELVASLITLAAPA